MPVRPIFLVHGVGSHKKGEFLSAMVESWIQFLRTQLGRDQVTAEVTLRPEHGPAHASLKFENEEWEIWEAFWQESFYPLKSYRVLMWGFMILVLHARSMLQGLIPFLRGPSRHPDSTDRIYQRRNKPETAWIYDPLVGGLAFCFFLVVYPISLIVASIFSSGPHHQDSGEAKIRESTAGVSRKPSSDCKACGCSSKHLCGLTAWNT